MELSMIWKSTTPPRIVRAAVSAGVLAANLQTSGADAQGPTWREWSSESCDEVVELRAHARNSKDPFVVPADQELLERVYFTPSWSEPVQVAAIYPLVDNQRVLADFTLHANEIAPREGVRRLYDWFPGHPSMYTPVPPVALILPPGQNALMLELHYYNLRSPAQVDQSGVALCLVRGAPQSASHAGVTTFDVPNLRIPRHTKSHVVSHTCTVQSDQPVLLQFAAPGMHKLGRSFRWSIEPGNGAPHSTLEADYAFGERKNYRLYPDPVVYRGDKITTSCTFDNPMDVDVGGGWRSNEEVCKVTVLYYPHNDFVCN